MSKKYFLTLILKNLTLVFVLALSLGLGSLAKADDDSSLDGAANDDEPTVARELSGFDPNLTAAYVLNAKAVQEADAENRGLDRALNDKVQRIWMRH